jgi:hypothetical protein
VSIVCAPEDILLRTHHARERDAAVVIGGELSIDDEGYMIQGDLSIADDVEHTSMRQTLLRYEAKKEAHRLAAEWSDSDLVVIRLKPKKVIRVY